jgi:hypothetical protein
MTYSCNLATARTCSSIELLNKDNMLVHRYIPEDKGKKHEIECFSIVKCNKVHMSQFSSTTRFIDLLLYKHMLLSIGARRSQQIHKQNSQGAELTSLSNPIPGTHKCFNCLDV